MTQIKINPEDTVIFDVDDTLAFFTHSFDAWLAGYFGVEHPDRDVHTDYNLLSPFKDNLPETATAEQVLRDFEATGRIEDPRYMRPTSVVDLAKVLHDKGINTLALTARAWMKDGHATTRTWLQKAGVSMPTYVLGLRDSKADWINQNINQTGGKVYLFEDNPHHIKQVFYKCPGVTTFVVDHPHNRGITPHMFERVDPNSTEWISV